MKRLTRAIVLLVPLSASADRNITVDGNNADWAGVTSCFNEPPNDSPPNGVELSRVCIENNNSSGNNGYLFVLFESPNALPTGRETWWGFSLDKNNDGQITSANEVWALYYRQGMQGQPEALEVRDPTSFALRRRYTNPANCGGPAGANGWSGMRGNKVVEMAVAYGCLGLTFGNDTRRFQMGVYPSFDTTTPSYYDGTTGALVVEGPPPDVRHLVVLSGNGQNRLIWTNPPEHEGVLVLRAVGAPPDTAPTKRVRYTVGQTLGNAAVVYADGAPRSSVSTFTDAALTNGTKYYYRVYNHHQVYTYASGNVPGPNGIFSIPTDGVSPNPRWCYSFGFPSTMQPLMALGSGVFLASNSGAITANNPDGSERFRPIQLNGAVQGRFWALSALAGRSGTFLIVGDQAGHAHLVDASTGNVVWSRKVADSIQAQPAVQLYANAVSDQNTAFTAANPNRDLLFFASRNASPTNNVVTALSSVDGSVVWTYAPGNLDIVSGGMLVDRIRNRLWVASRASGGPSVRVLSTLNGALLASFNVGDVDLPITWGYTSGEAIVTTRSGVVYGFSLDAMTQSWTHTTGAQSSYAFPTGDGFIASLSAGTVQRYRIDPTTKAVTVPLWEG